MLLYFIAVPVAFLVAQGFWVSLAFTSLGAISALAAFAWTQHQLNLIAA